MKRVVLGLGFALAAGSVAWIASQLGDTESDSLQNDRSAPEGPAREAEAIVAPKGEPAVRAGETAAAEPTVASEDTVESLAQLEDAFVLLERELAQERSELFQARFDAGDFEVVPGDSGPLQPDRTFDGLDVELSWRHAERAGEAVLEVVTLPVADYPNYYRRVAERNALRLRIDELAGSPP